MTEAMNGGPTPAQLAMETAAVARELNDGYSHFDLTHTECDERYAELKRRMSALLRGLREPTSRAARLALELAEAEQLFSAVGGRGVELAERIDQLRDELRMDERAVG